MKDTKYKTMENIKLKYPQSSHNYYAIAEVAATNESEAESILDSYLGDELSNYGRKDSHLEEDGKFYFKIVS